MHHRFTLVLILSIIHCCAGELLTLQQMVDSVFIKNPQVRELNAKGSLSGSELRSARATLFPVVQGSASLNAVNQNFTDSVDYNSTASVELRQTIFDMSIMRSYTASCLQYDSKTALFDRMRQQLAAEAALSFIDLWEASVQDSIARFNQLLLARHLDDTRTRFDAGELTRTDVYWAQGRLDDANSSLVTVEKALKTAKIRIYELGCDSIANVAIPSLYYSSNAEPDSVLIQKRPDIISLSKEVYASEVKYQAQLWSCAPRLSGYVQTGYLFKGHTNSNQAGMTLDIPILDGGLRNSSNKGAKYQIEILKAQLDKAIAAAHRELSIGRNDLICAQKLVEIAHRRDSIAKIVFDGVTEEFKAGTRTIQDAHDAQNELFLANINLVKERAALFRAIIRLRLASGMIHVNKMEDDQ